MNHHQPIGNTCVVCQKRLINRRPDTRTCSARCRTALYRRNRDGVVTLRLHLPTDAYNELQSQTNGGGAEAVTELLMDLLDAA